MLSCMEAACCLNAAPMLPPCFMHCFVGNTMEARGSVVRTNCAAEDFTEHVCCKHAPASSAFPLAFHVLVKQTNRRTDEPCRILYILRSSPCGISNSFVLHRLRADAFVLFASSIVTASSSAAGATPCSTIVSSATCNSSVENTSPVCGQQSIQLL